MCSLNIKDALNYRCLFIYLSLIKTLTDHQLWKCFPQQKKNSMLEKLLNEANKSFLLNLNQIGIFENFHKILLQDALNYNRLLKPDDLASIFMLTIRCLEYENFEASLMFKFCSYILVNPTIMKRLNENSTSLSLEAINKIRNIDLCHRIYCIFSHSDKVDGFLKNLDINKAISFFGNLCSLVRLDLQSLKINMDIFLVLNLRIFEHCSQMLPTNNQTVSNKQQNEGVITWHCLFGYLKIKSSLNYSEALMNILQQLKFLWSHQFITLLFDSTNVIAENVTKANFKHFIINIFDVSVKKSKDIINDKGSKPVFRISSFYR
jgi:hypothetical protein